jgi:hypothetical protein
VQRLEHDRELSFEAAAQGFRASREGACQERKRGNLTKDEFDRINRKAGKILKKKKQ